MNPDLRKFTGADRPREQLTTDATGLRAIALAVVFEADYQEEMAAFEPRPPTTREEHARNVIVYAAMGLWPLP